MTCEPHPQARFIVQQLPAVAQLSASTRDEAVGLVRGFAEKHAVDVWYREGDEFRLLEAYRVRPGTDAHFRARRPS